MNKYYRDNAMYDINIKGTYGLTADDVAAIEELKDAIERDAQNARDILGLPKA